MREYGVSKIRKLSSPKLQHLLSNIVTLKTFLRTEDKEELENIISLSLSRIPRTGLELLTATRNQRQAQILYFQRLMSGVNQSTAAEGDINLSRDLETEDGIYYILVIGAAIRRKFSITAVSEIYVSVY